MIRRTASLLAISLAAFGCAQEKIVKIGAVLPLTGEGEIYGQPVTDPEFGTPTLSGNGNFWEAPPLSSVSVTLRATF